jgi:hypothetical protein
MMDAISNPSSRCEFSYANRAANGCSEAHQAGLTSGLDSSRRRTGMAEPAVSYLASSREEIGPKYSNSSRTTSAFPEIVHDEDSFVISTNDAQLALSRSLEKLLHTCSLEHAQNHLTSERKFLQGNLVEILRSVLSTGPIRISQHTKNVEECEEFALILSTIESYVGEVGFYNLLVDPLVVDGYLYISVSTTSVD